MDEHVDTVVEYTISTIREAIRDGRFAQGQRLVVAHVAKKLGVSPGPVREAIRRLTGEGLIDITPHRGAMVHELKPSDVREIFQLREVVEGLAAKLAAENASISDYKDRVRASIVEMNEILANGGEGYVDHNHSFHELIYELANNSLLRETADRLSLPIYQLRYHHLMRRGYSKVSANEHMAIADAILDGDGPRADRAMRNHIRNSGEAMLEALEASNTNASRGSWSDARKPAQAS
jgi:DNA-binding GntR family transcriptional regulator